MYWNDHTVLDSDDDDDDDVEGQIIIVDVNAKLFLFQGGVNVAEKLLTLRFPLFTSTQAETFTGKYHF